MISIIICPTTCWSCKFGQCDDDPDPQPHPWWDMEDIECNEAAGLEPPTGYCGCWCTRDKVKALREAEAIVE